MCVSFLLSDTIIDNKILFTEIKFLSIKQEIDYFTVIMNNLPSVMIVTSKYIYITLYACLNVETITP